MQTIVKALTVLGLMAMALVGEHYKVPYTGWAVFIAVIVACSID